MPPFSSLRILGIAFFSLFLSFSHAQLVDISPQNPGPDDVMTVTFDATEGNQALLGYRGAVYMHSGVILDREDPAWVNIQGEWGKSDQRVRMRYMGSDRYQIRFIVKEFYKLKPGQTPLHFAFVFRNRDGSLIAKTATDEDIYVPPLAQEQPQQAPTLLSNQNMASCLGEIMEATEQGDGTLRLSDGTQSIEVRSYGKGTLQLNYLSDPTQQVPPSLSLEKPAVPIIDFEADTLYTVALGEGYTWQMRPASGQWEILQQGEIVLKSQSVCIDSSGEWMELRLRLEEEEQLYGLGARALPMNRRGYRLRNFHEAHYGYQFGEENLYMSLPYVQSSAGYSLLVDSHQDGWIDLGATESDQLSLSFSDSVLSCMILLGDPAQLTEKLTELTGRQPLPPRWTLGYLQSRFGYQSQQEAEEISLLTREQGFPLDGIFLDLYWFGGTRQMGELAWARAQWSDPEGMMGRLGALGIHTVPIIEPFIVKGTHAFDSLTRAGLLARGQDGSPAVIEGFWAGPAALLDIYNPQAQLWLWDKINPLIEAGAAGIWSDLVEPEKHPASMQHTVGAAHDWHNSFPRKWASSLYSAFSATYPDRRMFHLIRSSYTGGQKYGIFPWTGDVSRSWGGFRAQPSAMLGAGLSGLGYLHADLGGYAGESPGEELYIRWFQAGVFTPMMRVHAGLDGIEPEPIYHSPEAQVAAREAIQLRHRLTPYTYTLAYENTHMGWPLARPLFFHYPDDPVGYQIDLPYLWGRDILVLPILEEGVERQEMYFPEGRWYEGVTSTTYEGENWHEVAVRKDHIPYFIRGGAVIPTAQPARNLSQLGMDSLSLRVFWPETASADSSQLFWDDGETAGTIEKDDFVLYMIRSSFSEKGLDMRVERKGEFSHKGQMLEIEIIGGPGIPKRVKVGGRKLQEGEWRWDTRSNSLRFWLNWSELSKIQVKY